MVKTKELMLGNWVLAGSKTQFLMYVTGIFKDVAYLNFEGNKGDIWEEKEEDMFPILLTEELLLKNGFIKSQKDAFDIYEIEDETVFLFISTTHGTNKYLVSVNLEDLCIVEHKSIQYVHELQNIFTLAGLNFDFKV